MRINRTTGPVLLLILACAGGQLQSAGNPALGELKAGPCIECHGAGGNSTETDVPRLSGQMANYIIQATVEFKSKIRDNPRMTDVMDALNDPSDLEDIAAYFAAQPVMRGEPSDDSRATRGEKLFSSGRCNYCHGDGGKRFAPFALPVPVIGGQHQQYLIKAMRDIRAGKRPGDDFDMMKQTLQEYSAQDIEALAAYLSGL